MRLPTQLRNRRGGMDTGAGACGARAPLSGPIPHTRSANRRSGRRGTGPNNLARAIGPCGDTGTGPARHSHSLQGQVPGPPVHEAPGLQQVPGRTAEAREARSLRPGDASPTPLADHAPRTRHSYMEDPAPNGRRPGWAGPIGHGREPASLGGRAATAPAGHPVAVPKEPVDPVRWLGGIAGALHNRRGRAALGATPRPPLRRRGGQQRRQQPPERERRPPHEEGPRQPPARQEHRGHQAPAPQQQEPPRHGPETRHLAQQCATPAPRGGGR